MGKKGEFVLRNYSSDNLVEEDAASLDEGRPAPLQIMDQPLVANAVYGNTHGTVNPQYEADKDDRTDANNSAIQSPTSNTKVLSPLDAILAERQVVSPTTNCETMMHILKGNIGTGILAMPEALNNSGLAFGTVGLLFIGVLCVHCMHLLVKCARCLYVRCQVSALDYMDVAELSFKTGPSVLQRYSKIMRVVTISFLVATQFGFCCVYFLFVGKNFQQVIYDRTSLHLPYQAYIGMILPVLIGLTFIRNLKHLAYASTLANVLQVASFLILFYFLLDELPHSSTRKNFATWGQLPLWFGTAIYSFEGISLVLPLENKMRTPRDFGGLTGVLNTSMVVVACMYAAVGFFGYLKYGEDICGSVTLNLGTDVLASVVKLAYATAIFLTYLIQFYVPIEIMWPVVIQYCPIPPQYQRIAEYGFRAVIVLLSFALAAAVSNLGPMISLVGAVSGSFLTVIFPPMLELVTFWDEGISKWTIAKDIFITTVGVVGFFTGTYASINAIVNPPISSCEN